MKLRIFNSIYDTDTARKIAERKSASFNTDESFRETLFRKKGGEFFLFGEGGKESKYRKATAKGYINGQKIIPLTYKEADNWLKQASTTNPKLKPLYKRIFDISDAESKKVAVTFRVKQATKNKIEKIATIMNVHQGDVIDNLLKEYKEKK